MAHMRCCYIEAVFSRHIKEVRSVLVRRRNVIVMSSLIGEDHHEHHHCHSQLACRPGIDLPQYVIVGLRALGIIWQVKD